jgi:fatty acid desaturase
VGHNEGGWVSQEKSRRTVEWPTVALLIGFFAAWGAVVGWHRHIPWPVQFVVLVYLGGLWLSIGHELLHGHPTRWNWLNTAVGFVPLSLWIPFTRYRSSHIKHHRSDLTDPFDDPESNYVDPLVWQHAGQMHRRYILFLRTSPGRFTIGVPRSVLRFWRRDLRAMRTDGTVRLQWTVHLAGVALLCWWLFVIVGESVWVYLFAFVLGGVACSNLRSFVEHCAVPTGTRSAVVLAGPVMSLLFLNINLHHTHHALPDVEWYRIPAEHRAMGSDDIAAHGAGFYKNYVQVLRTYFTTPFCQPDHPDSPGARPFGARGIA